MLSPIRVYTFALDVRICKHVNI